jgi:type I restriction enzyme S subunit
MIMSDWIEKQLGDILALNYGWSLPEKKRVAGNVPVYGSNGVVGSHNQALVNSGGLIVGRKGSAGNVHYSRKPFCPIDTTFFIAPGNTNLDLEFLYYLLLHLDLKRILGDVGVPGLNREVAYKENARFPSNKGEQQKIAGVLGVVQRAMEQQERLIALTTELKKVLMHKLFTEGLRGEPQKQTEIGPVPQSWEVVKMGSIGKVVTGSTPKTKVPEYYSPPEVDFIAPADLGRTRLIYDSEKKISIAGLQTIRRLPKDAVMCVCIGSSIGKVGMTAKEVSATNQQINSIVCGERHESAFVYYLLSYLCDYWRGFATFGPVPILSKGSFEAIKIAVPPTKEEESEISRSLCALDAKAEVHMRKHAALTALFRTLLHQLMTAQIRVDQLDIEEFNVGRL